MRDMKRWIPLIISVVAVLAMFVFIFWMSAKPADESDSLSLGLIGRFIGFIVPGYGQMPFDEQMYWQHALNTPIRKLAHFTEYAVLGMLMLNAVMQVERVSGRSKPNGSTGSRRAAAIAWVLCTIYAITDEIHQLYVPGRTGKPLDVLIDSSGVLAGVLLAALAFHIVRKRRQRKRGDGASPTPL